MSGKGTGAAGHVSDLLSDYMDNQLDSKDRAVVEAHLRTCAACGEDLRTLRATVQVMRAMPLVAAPRSFILQPAFEPRRAPGLQIFLRLATAVTAVALFAILAGDLLLGNYQTAAVPAPLALSTGAADSSAGQSKAAAEAPRSFAPAATPRLGESGGPLAAAPPPTTAAVPTGQQQRSAAAAPTAAPAAAPPAAVPVATASAPATGAPAAAALAPAASGPEATASATALAATATRSPTPTATTTTTATATAAASATSTATVPATEAAQPAQTTLSPAAAQAPATNATSGARPLELGLAALLAVLLGALVVSGRRQK